MTKDVVKNLFIFLLLVLLDQFSKYLSQGLSTYHLNHGIMLGLLSDSSFFFRLTTLASFFGFLFSIYLVFIYLLKSELKYFKFGMTFMISGILGNILDKIFLSASRDFIPLNLSIVEFRFNLADVFLWIGACIIIFKLVRREHLIWYPNNKRGKLLLFEKEQRLFAFKLALVSLCSSLIFGVFCFSFVKAVLLENNIESTNYFLHFSISYLFFTLIFGLIVFISGLMLSHRTAGPIYSFIKYIDDVIDKKKEEEFKLRVGDNYKYLEGVARKIKSHLR